MAITPVWNWARTHARIRNTYVTETMAEFFGTMLLLFMAVGSGLHAHLLKDDSILQPVLGTTFGLMISILIFGGISGAHINPAVSVGLALAGELSWLKVPFYILAQMFGAFFGSLLAYGLHHDALYAEFVGVPGSISGTIVEYDTANGLQILASFTPRPSSSLGVGFASEVILTTILLSAVLAVIDKRNMKVPKFFIPLTFALTVSGLALAQSVPSGTLLNPSRDMGPRLAAWALGWDSDACFKNVNYKGNVQEWWIVGIFGPLVGAVVGVLFYTFVVGAHLPSEGEEEGTKAEGGDWRHTAFIPKTGLVSNNNISGPVSMPTTPLHQHPYQPPNNTRGQGHYNSGYQG